MTPRVPPRSWIERTAVRLGLIAPLPADALVDSDCAAADSTTRSALDRFPPPERWNDHVEFDARAWPKQRIAHHYRLVPTTCFNCEAACGLLAYVDKKTGKIRKLEGNPLHPASRGRNCAKGPATINQVTDPDRILAPQKRIGPRGGGEWREVSWDEAIADIAGRIRKALQENRRDEIVYHVGRPGAEGFIDRILRAWGVDGHNSHTNICSSGARLGYALWWGYDRPTPDYANARFILALNAHLESGHYFNPMAQRISEGLARGAKLAVIDPRLSNTASMASHWLPCKPGTEAALLLAFAHVILNEQLYDRAFVERWVNWREYLGSVGVPPAARSGADSAEPAAKSYRPEADAPRHVDMFFDQLRRLYAGFTPQFAERECGIPADTVVRVAREIAAARARFCSHCWRGAPSAHLGGWQVPRCLMLLHALTGSVGTAGGCLPAGWSKYKASLVNVPPPQNHWNELHWPREFPLAHYEMSELLPHFLLAGRGRIDVYFTRVFNPVWTYPDGFTWIEALRDERGIGLHVALTPTWNETALFADYVLPMGHGPERHDLNTYETHSGTWIAFRQPVLKAHALAEGRTVRDTRDVNPGRVWEEDEFWLALTWAIDPDGSMGIRRYVESVKKPGTPLTVDEYYAYAFERVPGLPEAARKKDLAPLDYMRKFGAFEVKKREYRRHERELSDGEMRGTTCGADSLVRTASGAAVGVRQFQDGAWKVVEGFPTPSRRLEFYSPTLADWGWPEYAVPGYIPSHVYENAECKMQNANALSAGADASTADDIAGTAPQSSNPESKFQNPESAAMRATDGTFCLLPTFRLPTLIHTRSGGTKWLNEISQRNPIWIHTSDARRLGLRTGDLARVTTRIGYFVDKVWVTEAIRPGVVACSHHLGRWRRPQDPPNARWSGNVVLIEELPRPCHESADEGGDEATKPRSHEADQFESQNPESRIVSGRCWRMRTISGPQPFDSPDPDSRRVWWREGGVHQNITFPVQPDPISGMHCWHQSVRVTPAEPEDRCGDVFVDTRKSMEVFREWMQRTRWPVGPDPGTDGRRLRRPLWLNRPLRPADQAYYMAPSTK